ncbi:MAG: hypothetical protein A2252_06050 [Elusimicrobia bacterium RIFOXYA2_FULL_39_19]|nr:MAG: hypothetical protein A2252_06050 [Elusimicrobia bacterium RIFOXYA2_FULL_39_19]
MIENIQIREWFYKNKGQNNEISKIFDVEYIHQILENKDDLYITKHGLPFIKHLQPDNFYTDKEWFRKNSKRLPGSSSIYKVRTKKLNGKTKDFVIKWNRMGQDVPGERESSELINARFNSPFEEFSLVMELRNETYKSSERIIIQKPLAIYVPFEHAELWQTGRKEYLMQTKIDLHKEIKLDIHRSYAVIYEWIEGIDVDQACTLEILDKDYVEDITVKTAEKIKKNGFIVKDRKPSHIIVRPKEDKTLTKYKEGDILHALIDFELLERTPERLKEVKEGKRADYLKRQRDRFLIEAPDKLHPHLKHTKILGVDYVYGHVESTKGRLWVVGKDPYLFDYFLPECWENVPKTRISTYNEMYYVVTKDGIHVVWKVSNVGLMPDMDLFKEDERKILEHGYNSPFEEISIAIELNKKGIATSYPRAVYMTGNKSVITAKLYDDSRYESHKNYFTPDKQLVLEKDRDYITIWGYWNGPDEKLAAKDGDYYEGISALRACREGIISQEEYLSLLQTLKEKLSKENIEDLNLRGNHILLSLDCTGTLIKDKSGIPEMRICNFEFLKRTE